MGQKVMGREERRGKIIDHPLPVQVRLLLIRREEQKFNKTASSGKLIENALRQTCPSCWQFETLFPHFYLIYAFRSCQSAVCFSSMLHGELLLGGRE